MTLPTPSELPHPRCRQFCCRIVYRPSFSLGFKKANRCGVCRSTGNPRSPGVAPVSFGVKGRWLSVDRVWRHSSSPPAGGSFAPSSIRIHTGRPRPWDPGARPHPDRGATRTMSVPYPVPSASLLPGGHYRPNKSCRQTRRSTLPDSGHGRKRSPLLGADSSSDPKGCDSRPIRPWWSAPSLAQDRPPQRRTHPNTLWRSKPSCRFII
jgi:hypothetical protein